jgi:hypothetical protein
MYYPYTICHFSAYYSKLCIIISNIKLGVTIGHIQKKDANRKLRKTNETKITPKKHHIKYEKPIGKKFQSLKKNL